MRILIQMKAFVNRQNRLAGCLAYCSLLLVISVMACKKEAAGPGPGTDPEDATTGNFYKLIRVENLAGDTTSSGDPEKPKEDFFFSLEQNKRFNASYAKTSQWDMAFTGIENVGISGNNGADVNNFGYGNQARGGVAVLTKHFNEVTELPASLAIKTNKSGVNLDDGGAFGGGIGWVLYDFGGSIIGDGSYDKQHVAYALQDTRTLIVKTAKGNYAKIRMISIYKNVFTWDKMFRNTPHPYFTFEYILIPAGSTKFEVRP